MIITRSLSNGLSKSKTTPTLRHLQMTTLTDGLFAINKPAGMSSAHVLRDIQHIFKRSTAFADAVQREQDRIARESHYQQNRRRQSKRQTLVKIGHGGTLDPMATGVLIAGIGLGTKRLGNLLDSTKSYEATAIFGIATDTYDNVGKITKRTPYTHLTAESVEAVLDQFRGAIMQRPPIYSALHIDGKRLYEYAREGKPLPVEIQKRPVTVSELVLVEFVPGTEHSRGYPVKEAAEDEKRTIEAIEKLEVGKDGELKGEIKVEMSEGAIPTPTGEKRKADEAELDEVEEAKKVKVEQANIIEAGTSQPQQGRSSKRKDKKSKNNNRDPADLGRGQGLPEPDESSDKFHEDVRPPIMKIRMTVSKGTYVRSLLHDIGEALGSSATMIDLCRTRQGNFEVGKNAIEWSEFAEDKPVEEWESKVLSALQESKDWQ